MTFTLNIIAGAIVSIETVILFKDPGNIQNSVEKCLDARKLHEMNHNKLYWEYQ